MKYFYTLFYCLFLLNCSDRNIKQYDENNNLIEAYSIDNNKLKHGIYRSYFASGKIREESHYNMGMLKGIRKIFYENGQKEIEETYSENGILDGPYLSYYPSGELKQQKYYANNVMSDTLKLYYPNGKIKELVTMENNQENGPFELMFKRPISISSCSS